MPQFDEASIQKPVLIGSPLVISDLETEAIKSRADHQQRQMDTKLEIRDWSRLSEQQDLSQSQVANSLFLTAP